MFGRGVLHVPWSKFLPLSFKVSEQTGLQTFRAVCICHRMDTLKKNCLKNHVHSLKLMASSFGKKTSQRERKLVFPNNNFTSSLPIRYLQSFCTFQIVIAALDHQQDVSFREGKLLIQRLWAPNRCQYFRMFDSQLHFHLVSNTHTRFALWMFHWLHLKKVGWFYTIIYHYIQSPLSRNHFFAKQKSFQ